MSRTRVVVVVFFITIVSVAMAQDYDVTVVTGTADGAGTDASVYMTLYGRSGTSPEINLTELKPTAARAGLFENGAWDAFVVPRSRVGSIGTIDRIKIRHDNGGNRPGWWLGAVMVYDPVGKDRAVFIPDRWLARDEVDGKTEVTTGRSAYGYRVFSPPFSDKAPWGADTPGVAAARARANGTSGGISLYADAFAGGSAVQSTVGARFDMAAGKPLFVRAELVYTGGLVNAFVASFSELRMVMIGNGTERFFDLSPAFTGPIVIEKVVAIGLMATGAAAGASGMAAAAEAIETVGLINDAMSLGNTMYTLSQAGNARSEQRTAAFGSVSGRNTILAGLRVNVSAMLTGSSFGIVGGQVRSIEVIGCPPAVATTPATTASAPTQAAPPATTPATTPFVPAQTGRTLVLDCAKSLEYPKYNRCWGWHEAHTWNLGGAMAIQTISGEVYPGPSERAGQSLAIRVQTSSDGKAWTDAGTVQTVIGRNNTFGPVQVHRLASFVRLWTAGAGYIDASRVTVVGE